MEFSNNDYWKGIILYGLNAATYKMALASSLLSFARKGQSEIGWGELSRDYLNRYVTRIRANSMPQQNTPGRLTKMERIVKDLVDGRINKTKAVDLVGNSAFVDVVPRFQKIGSDDEIVRNLFYEYDYGKKIVLTDDILEVASVDFDETVSEIEARWSLLEGAFSINQGNFHLANDIRDIYLNDGYDRTPLTTNIPFLRGYQGDVCFYCGDALGADIHVDHVLPRQVICHDEIWNLVLSHGECNLQKSDKLVGPHFIEKLIARNENIMGSNHPWKHKISSQLGSTPRHRAMALSNHYNNMKIALGANYWGGAESYNPETDPFYRRLITTLNNRHLII